MKVELSQLVFFKEVVIEKGRRIAELSGRYLEVLLNFLSGLWVIGLKNGYSLSMEAVPGGETRSKWPISQYARGNRWCVAKEVAVGEVGASILDVEVSDVLSGKYKARASCCRLLRILIARRLNVIGFSR